MKLLVLSATTLLALAPLDLSEAFQIGSVKKQGLLVSTTALNANNNKHQFNGGYDASNVEASAKWTPREAAEFVIWHLGDNHEEMGRQLTPLIQNWTGKDLGEFLSRLYLGETTDDFDITFESHNVRTPQWKGLDTVYGILALKDLLRTALPGGLLEEAIEMAHVAEVFLWKVHTWPALDPPPQVKKSGKESIPLERDSFASLGYTPAIVNIWMELREERGGNRNFLYTAEDVLEMVPSKLETTLQLRGMQEFFVHMGIRLAPSCKIELVQGMAKSGWNPGKIAKFVSSIPEIPEEEKKQTVIQDQVVDKKVVVQLPPIQVPPPPLEKSHLDNVTSYTQYIKESQKDVNRNEEKGKGIELPAAQVPGFVSQEFLANGIRDPLEAVRKKIQASKRTAPWQ